jgi:polynucleotide 5'-hydroxyl-kinase GRC3/NOL9
MEKTVEKGKTLLVDGPASVTLTSGSAEVFGLPVKTASKVIIREGKRLPFSVEKKATFDVSLGEGATVEEMDENSIPPSWEKAYEELVNLQARPAISLILGTADSGKTSFATYLTNRLVREQCKVALLDGDLGQSDIGPPCTVAYTLPTKPTTDLFNLTAKNAFFVGITSPSSTVDKVIEGLTLLKEEALKSSPDFLVINTDGWIDEEEAVRYKSRVVESLNPHMVFCIQQGEELAPLMSKLERFKRTFVESPKAVRQRTHERRRNLRELGYIKYLKNAKVQSLPLNWLKVEEDELFGLSKKYENNQRVLRINALLGMKPLNILELPDKLHVIIGRNRWINSENIKKVEEYTKKKMVIIRKGEEEGLLTGLYNANKHFLGIGILKEIDFLRKTLKILTPVSGEVAGVTLGKLKLDKNFKEFPVFPEDNDSFKTFKKLF